MDAWTMVSKMFDGVKPFDWLMLVVEILVLLLIAYEVGTTVLHRLQTKRRLASLFALMHRGQELQTTVPGSGTTDDQAVAWKSSVEAWANDTHKILATYSPQASARFLHNPVVSRGIYRGIAQNAQGYYESLMMRLENLRAIMEKPEVYF
jgi:hypothetical protein